MFHSQISNDLLDVLVAPSGLPPHGGTELLPLAPGPGPGARHPNPASGQDVCHQAALLTSLEHDLLISMLMTYLQKSPPCPAPPPHPVELPVVYTVYPVVLRQHHDHAVARGRVPARPPGNTAAIVEMLKVHSVLSKVQIHYNHT